MPATLNQNPEVLWERRRIEPEPTFPLITEAAKLTLKPGDVLVLRINTPTLSADMHNGAKKWLAEHLPPGIRTLILSNRESLQVIQADARGSEEGNW
jgi:hypothetical protein